LTASEAPQTGHTILTAATKKELKYALAFFSNVPDRLEMGKAIPRKLGDQNFLLLVTGIGPVNAALNLGKVLGGSVPVKGVVSVGIGGSFDLDLHPLKTAVLVKEEIWPEFGLKTHENICPRSLGQPLCKKDDKKNIWDRIELDPQKDTKNLGLGSLDHLPCVRSITVAGVTGTRREAKRLQAKYSAQLENMEGFALARACLDADLPFLELRTVSNLVGSRDKRYWDIKSGLQELGRICRLLLSASESEEDD